MRVIDGIGAGIGVGIGLYSAYGIKVAMNINLDLFGKEHFPSVIERSTHGVVKCEWFPNPHHCHHKKR